MMEANPCEVREEREKGREEREMENKKEIEREGEKERDREIEHGTTGQAWQ